MLWVSAPENQMVLLKLKLDLPLSKALTLPHIYHPLPHSSHLHVWLCFGLNAAKMSWGTKQGGIG